VSVQLFPPRTIYAEQLNRNQKWVGKSYLGSSTVQIRDVFFGRFTALQILGVSPSKPSLIIHKWGSIFGSLTYGLGTLFIKTSILLFYLRLPSTRAFRIVTCGVLLVACGYCLFGTFTWLFMCRPMKAYWDVTAEGKCLSFKNAFLVGGVFNVATDVVMLLLPIWVLRPLRLPRKQKIGVTLVLMTGSL
jgi:hypothetical protein